MNYRCTVCGCYLDRGEGRICEDCRKKVLQTCQHPQDQGTAKAVTNPQVHDTTIFTEKERGKCRRLKK